MKATHVFFIYLFVESKNIYFDKDSLDYLYISL